MKKNVFNWMLAAALMFGLGMSVTSCKDDDDEQKSEEQKEKEAQEKASNFWSVVGQLVSVDDVTEDYQGKTFEPTYGLADPTNDVTRIVNTNDMKTAAQRFANLVDAKGIDEITPSYTWSDPEIGTMTYTRGGDAANWATVDVNIKAVPKLQKIIYREGGEGVNGKFEGKAYYRFGDVVSREIPIKFDQKKNNDGRQTITEYWICVRPAFGPEGKEDSHWVCVNTVGDKNYKYYKASTGKDYWLPTKLGTNKEHMQNFAELLWAITHPNDWYTNVKDHHKDGTLWGFDGVPFFTDFKRANLDLHNQYFWKNVQSGWREKKVAEKALDMPSFDQLTNSVVRNGVHLLYNGYSWWFTTSWNCQLWEAVYTNAKKEEELNMHHVEYNEEIEKDMKEIKFDCRLMGQNTGNYNGFFNYDNTYRWTIRHATGKELATDKKYDVKKPINGVKEEYRYYRDVVKTDDLSGKPESTSYSGNNDKTMWNLTDFTDQGFYKIGNVYKDENGHRWFVISMSGKDDNNQSYEGNTIEEKETAPYAELVSFDGLVLSPDGKYATNLGTFNQTVRAFYYMHLFFTNTAHLKDNNFNYSNASRLIKHIIDNCDVDLRYINLLRVAKSGYQRSATHTCSVAYRDNAVTDGQALFRYLYPMDISNENMHHIFWKNYVTYPDVTTEAYSEEEFSNVRICLQHIADANYVNKYAKDFYACQPIDNMKTGVVETKKHPYRTETEPRASDITNYYYNRQAFFNDTAPLDMWNAPILMFRTAAVYDRGPEDHATITLDGHTLTLFKECEIYDLEARTLDDIEMNIRNIYEILNGGWSSLKNPTNWLDGKLFTLPSWRETWQN